jgi:hypothetical protein
LFVVLLVICSLLLSTSVVVFVNRVDDFQKQVVTARTELDGAKRGSSETSKALNSERASAQAAAAAANARETKLNSDISLLNQQVQDKGVTIAKLDVDNKVAQTHLTALTGALTASQAENKALQDYLADTQTKKGDLVKSNMELNIAVSELTGKNDSLQKTAKFLEEQVEQQKKQIGQMGAVMQTAGIKYDTQTGEAAKGGQAVVGIPGQLIGQINDTSIIGGVRYATISIGSSDNVTKGMKFYVVDKNSGEFYGILIVDNVQPTEAIGQLEGPKVQQVAKGLEVKTQL